MLSLAENGRGFQVKLVTHYCKIDDLFYGEKCFLLFFFYFAVSDALERGCIPFFVDNRQVGLIRPDFLLHMKEYKDVLLVHEESCLDGKKPGVHLSSEYRTYKERSAAVNCMLKDLKQKDVILALRGWRQEVVILRISSIGLSLNFQNVNCVENIDIDDEKKKKPD